MNITYSKLYYNVILQPVHIPLGLYLLKLKETPKTRIVKIFENRVLLLSYAVELVCNELKDFVFKIRFYFHETSVENIPLLMSMEYVFKLFLTLH